MALTDNDMPQLLAMLNRINIRMQQRRKTAAAWTAGNEVLRAGEIGIETDTQRSKLGDGATVWTLLPYVGPGPYDLATAPADKQVLTFNLASGKWKPETPSGSNGGLSGLSLDDGTLLDSPAGTLTPPSLVQSYIQMIVGGQFLLVPAYKRKVVSTATGAWINAYLAASGTPVFAFEFDNNAADVSGNGNTTSISGTITYTSDDPAPGGGYAANVTGATYVNLPGAANVTGAEPWTLIGIVKVPSTGFASSSGGHHLWAGGADATRRAISMSFTGDATPALMCDFEYATMNAPIPSALVNAWMTAIFTYDGTTLRMYASGAGQPLTKVGEAAQSINVYPDKNALFQWNNIRRFIGACAFVGLKKGVMTEVELAQFLIP